MSVLAVANTLGYARLGLALSRKAVPLAVNRNRIKRLVRESFRSEQAHLGSIDVVIVGRRGLDQLENRDIRESLKKHWTRLSQRACKPFSSS
jgi:ribonuclease P protein component